MLAFEPFICPEYVSFKYFSIMDSPNTVPIVMGGANYASLAPPMSFIDVANFKSAKELANYLLYLHQNDGNYSFIYSVVLK